MKLDFCYLNIAFQSVLHHYKYHDECQQEVIILFYSLQVDLDQLIQALHGPLLPC